MPKDKAIVPEVRPEREIVAEIMAGLKLSGYMAWHTHDTRNHPTTKGMPDIMAVKDGRLLAVEVKRQRGRIRADQLTFLAILKAHETPAIIAYSWEDVAKVIW